MAIGSVDWKSPKKITARMLRKQREQDYLLQVHSDLAEKVTSMEEQDLSPESESMYDKLNEDKTDTILSGHNRVVEKKEYKLTKEKVTLVENYSSLSIENASKNFLSVLPYINMELNAQPSFLVSSGKS